MSLPPKHMFARIWGWGFHFRLDELRRAYNAAREASDQKRKEIEEEYRNLELEVAAGHVTLTEEDEHGRIVYDHGEHMGEMLADIESVLAILRESFVISLHHLWEREVNKQMGKRSYNEVNAMAFLKDKGIVPDELTLKALRLTANVAKHSEGNSADELFELRPDLFDVDRIYNDNRALNEWNADNTKKKSMRSPGHEYLLIADHDFEQFFAAVRNSGPEFDGTYDLE